MINPKKCEYCKKEFAPKYNVTLKYWEKRKYCSNECRIIDSVGNAPNLMKGKKRVSLLESFWSKVKKGGENECWIWEGAKEVAGYGYMFVQRNPIKWKKAQVFSYEIHKGEIKKGLHVCHSCDNPPCVNPNHLWLGTTVDNIKDRDKKGRNNKGKKYNLTRNKQV